MIKTELLNGCFCRDIVISCSRNLAAMIECETRRTIEA